MDHVLLSTQNGAIDTSPFSTCKAVYGSGLHREERRNQTLQLNVTRMPTSHLSDCNGVNELQDLHVDETERNRTNVVVGV